MPLPLALVAVAIFSFIPGWLLLLAWPGLYTRLSGTERVATAAGISALLLVGFGLLLARLGWFSSGPIIGIEISTIAVASYLSRKRLTQLIRGAPGQMVLLRGIGRRRPAILVPPLAFAAVIAPYLHYALGGVRAQNVPWAYMADISQLLSMGSIPETSFEWGVERPYSLSKLGGYIWVGALRAVSGLGELDALQYVHLVFVIVALLGTLAFLRLFMGRLAASAGLVLLFANFGLVHLPAVRLTKLGMEGVGLSLAFLVLWAIIKADRRRIHQLRWLAFAWLLMIGLTHGVVFLMTLLAIAVYVATKLLARIMSWRTLVRDAALYIVVPVAVVTSGILAGSSVEILSGARSESNYELVDGVGDPTVALGLVLRGGSIHDAPPPQVGLSPSPGEYFDRILPGTRTWIGRIAREHSTLVIAWAFVAAIGGFLLAPHLRWVFVALLLFGAGIFGLAIVFSFHYDLWIYTHHPLRREFKYIPVALVLMGLMLFQARSLRVALRLASEGRQLLVAISVVAILALVYTVTVTSDAGWREPRPSEAEEQTMAWLQENTSADSRILTNVRTTGRFELGAGRVSITEGSVLYLFPELLSHSLRLLDEAQGWFRKPEPEFLHKWGVSHVVVHMGGKSPRGLSARPYAIVTRTGPFDRASFLEKEARFGIVVIYSLVDDQVVGETGVSVWENSDLRTSSGQVPERAN